MCLVLIAMKQHARWPLIVAANRDEYFGRPAAAADWWPGHPHVLAGRDLQAGGTWFGVTRAGRFAAVTNLRGGATAVEAAMSRGSLVREYLIGDASPAEHARQVAAGRSRCNPFNFVCGDLDELWLASSALAEPLRCDAGMQAVGNAQPGDSWPKIRRGREALGELDGGSDDGMTAQLLALLSDTTVPPDRELPAGAKDMELERKLAPIFVRAGEYGTRASTVLLVGAGGEARFTERRFDAGGAVADTSFLEFHVEQAA
jgi:uncharacterized protein with NRDE domain